MLRYLENHLLVGFVQAFFIGEDKIRDAVTAVIFGDLVGTVKDNIKGFRMDAHLQVRGIAGEMMQEMVNFIYQCVAEGGSGFYFFLGHSCLF